MKIEILVKRILNELESKTKQKYNPEDVMKYLRKIQLWYISFWFVMDYLEENENFIIKHTKWE